MTLRHWYFSQLLLLSRSARDKVYPHEMLMASLFCRQLDTPRGCLVGCGARTNLATVIVAANIQPKEEAKARYHYFFPQFFFI